MGKYKNKNWVKSFSDLIPIRGYFGYKNEKKMGEYKYENQVKKR